MPPTIMFVGAHHDDNELMAGTIARHRGAGWNIVSMVMTNGSWTHKGVSDDNIEIRNDESRAAAELLGMESVFLGLHEGILEHTMETCRAVVAVLRRSRPDVVVTHPPRDYHADHMATSRTVEDAVYRAGCPAFDVPGPPHGGIQLYYCDAWAMPFEPDTYIDVTDYAELKREALACHKSQLVGGVPTRSDMIDIELTRSRYRGFESGFDYAEAYRFVPRPGSIRNAELLG